MPISRKSRRRFRAARTRFAPLRSTATNCLLWRAMILYRGWECSSLGKEKTFSESVFNSAADTLWYGLRSYFIRQTVPVSKRIVYPNQLLVHYWGFVARGVTSNVFEFLHFRHFSRTMLHVSKTIQLFHRRKRIAELPWPNLGTFNNIFFIFFFVN